MDRLGEGEQAIMSRILITGGDGFIGNCLCSALKDRHELYGLVRKPNASNSAQWIIGDLTKPLDKKTLPGALDAIVHLAQSRHDKAFPEQANDIFEVNLASTARLLEYGKNAGIKHFIYASSGGLYGFGPSPFSETDPVRPSDFYLASKYASELLTGHYQPFFRIVVFRFFFVYGPGQKNRLIPNLLRQLNHGETLRIEGNPGLRINPIHVRDAVRVFEPALKQNTSGLFNVAGEETVSLTDLIRILEEITAKKGKISYLDARQPGDLIGANLKMKKTLGVEPSISIRSGLQSIAMQKET